MRSAQRLLAGQPGLVLWAEVAVLAHLTGWLMPVPVAGGELADQIAALSLARLRDCAVSHAVDAAVAARASTFAARVSPGALASHVAAALRRWITDAGRECSFPEPHWLAPAFRWALILDDLKTLDRKAPGSGRHPRTADWEASTGRPIPGATCAQQIGVVQRWHDADQRNPATVRRDRVRDRTARGPRDGSRRETRRRRLDAAPVRGAHPAARLPLAPGLPARRRGHHRF